MLLSNGFPEHPKVPPLSGRIFSCRESASRVWEWTVADIDNMLKHFLYFRGFRSCMELLPVAIKNIFQSTTNVGSSKDYTVFEIIQIGPRIEKTEPSKRYKGQITRRCVCVCVNPLLLSTLQSYTGFSLLWGPLSGALGQSGSRHWIPKRYFSIVWCMEDKR